jgi:hypothetical protein
MLIDYYNNIILGVNEEDCQVKMLIDFGNKPIFLVLYKDEYHWAIPFKRPL